MQFLLVGGFLLLCRQPNSLYRRHQIADQCACVHCPTSIWIPTTEPVKQLSAISRQLSASFFRQIFVRLLTSIFRPGTPLQLCRELRQVFRSQTFGSRLWASAFRLPLPIFCYAFRKPEAESRKPLNFFRCPQFRAAGPRVAIAFQFSCRYRLL